MPGHCILAYRYLLHFAVISGGCCYRFQRRQRCNIGETQLLQIRQLKTRHPLQNMSQRMGPFITETFRIRRFADTNTIKNDKSNSFK
ncbi:hypothetical protein D3C75_1179060 [compost metagenome]